MPFTIVIKMVLLFSMEYMYCVCVFTFACLFVCLFLCGPVTHGCIIATVKLYLNEVEVPGHEPPVQQVLHIIQVREVGGANQCVGCGLAESSVWQLLRHRTRSVSAE